VTRTVGIGLVRIVDSAQEVQRCSVGLDGVEAEASSVNSAQIKELQGVAAEVRGTEGEEIGIHVAVVAESPVIEIGDRAGSGKIVGSVDRTGVERDLVIETGMNGVEGQSQVFGFAVAAGDGESDIGSARPAVPESGMQRLVEGGLLGIVADKSHVVFGGLDSAAGRGGDFNLAVRGGDRANCGLAAFERYVEFFIRSDFLNGGELDGDIAGGVGVEDESFPVRLDDGAGQAVAVFQRHLICEERR
jgi:hypothetical protein